LIHAVSGSTVPHISLQVGNSYGAGNYAMCGRSFEPRFLFSYPNAKSGVMGADQLSGVMEIIKRNSASSLNKVIDEEKLKIEKRKLAEQADQKASVWHTTLRFGTMELLIQLILENIYPWLWLLFIVMK